MNQIPKSAAFLLPGMIEVQERHGQDALINTAQLPVYCRGRFALEKAGVVFGDRDADDPIFCAATLPDGWTKVPSPNSSYWSYLLDDKGRRRAMIFYKAAFYDRSAHMDVLPRFTVDVDYGDNDRTAKVLDGDAVIWQSETIPGNDYSVSENVRNQANSWLAEHYPLHADCSAYWND